MPLDERIFLGGDDCVRGYRPYRLGPQYHQTINQIRVGTHVPRGGLSLQLYSIEYAHRLGSMAELFTFVDAGHLSSHIWHFGRVSVSTGLGFRFKLIASVPPVTLGMGFPLNPRNRSEVKKFFMSFGGDF